MPRKLFDRAIPGRQNRNPTSDYYDDRRSPSPSSSYEHQSSNMHQNAPMEVQYGDDLLIPPNLPFSEVTGGQYADSSRQSSFGDLSEYRSNSKDNRPPSLSINYVPTKFTKLHQQGEWAHRRAKQGGGRDAFARDAQRMGDPGTVDDDQGLVFQLGKGGLKAKHKPKLRWNRFKWTLFVANSVFIIYAMGTLISAILVWLNVFYRSDVIRVGNRTELILSTIGPSLMVFTSLLGFSGIVLNNRAFLAVYVLLLWICLAFIVAPGYITYKKKTFNLEGKINLQWSRNLGTIGRLRIQDALRCCGYFSPFYEATISPLCYPRSIEDGCKNRYLKLERMVLRTWYTVSFSLVPPHLILILLGLLCSNHITYRFGKGLTPKRYRLDLDSMNIIMNDYAQQIAAQYGPAVAGEALSRSSLHLNEDGRSTPTGSRPGSRRGSNAASQRAMSSRLAQSAQNHDNGYGDYESPFIDGSSDSNHNNGYASGPSREYHSPAGSREYHSPTGQSQPLAPGQSHGWAQ